MDRLTENLAAKAQYARFQEEDAKCHDYELREVQAREPHVHLVDEGPVTATTHTIFIAVLVKALLQGFHTVAVSERAINVPLVVEVLEPLTEAISLVFCAFLIKDGLNVTHIPPSRLVKLLYHEGSQDQSQQN